MNTPIWQPGPDTNIARFARTLRDVGHHDVTQYPSLHDWTVAEPAAFWTAVWETFGVIGERGVTAIESDGTLAATRFFPAARLNFAENLLRRRDSSPALFFRDEIGTTIDWSWADLYDLVGRIAVAMRSSGIEPGDRVAAWLPNRPETIAVMLAASSIGAVFSSTSPDFGSAGVLDRFEQIEPRLLFAADGYHYAGSARDCLERLAAIAGALPSVEHVIVIPYLDDTPNIGAIEHGVAFDDWIAPTAPHHIDFTPLPFDHPLYILFSSGTTGAPKCIVHRAGGILLKHLTEHRLHCNVSANDRLFYFTTAGWMMWNWLASGLASEASLVLYDGSPMHRDGAALFDVVDELNVTLFGTSAKFIDALAKAGASPNTTHDLESIQTICSTGSPLAPAGFDYVNRFISASAHLASISGGTDLCGCLVAGDPSRPVFAGEIQTAAFGLDTHVVDDAGNPVAPGERGELVCRNAFPSMPLGFWNDDGDVRFRATYFERFADTWHQGDFAERTIAGGFVIHGRSDATLNPGGVRIGTAEIYRQVEQLDVVVESLVIGQAWEGDTRIVLFVVLRDGVALDDNVRKQIRSLIRSGATPRHVPARIAAVPELPRTRSGKLVELAVREVVHGRPVKNREALANPEALKHVLDHPELRT